MPAGAPLEGLGFTSLLPALVTIGLSFATRRVLPSLLTGVLVASVVLFAHTGEAKDLNPIGRFLLPAIGSGSFARILLIYLWALGGLVGIWEKTGAALHFAEAMGRRFVSGPRSALVYAWVLGMVFHQGGTVSTVLAGTAARPVCDRHRISHEELSYVVDSTASPVATVVPFNAWPTYIAGLVAGSVPLLATESDAVMFFFRSIPFNFYGIFAVFGTLLFALGWMPWVGSKMARARVRARTEGLLDGPGAAPMSTAASGESLGVKVPGYRTSLADFLVPLGVLMGIAVVPFALKAAGLISNGDWINEAFVASVVAAGLVALGRGMKLDDVLDGFIGGCKSMTLGALILGLAVTLGGVTKELGTAAYLTSLFEGSLPALALPGALTLLCMGIAFASGTSWGTYAVVFPVALPLAWSLSPDPTYLSICFGAVVGGSVFGDQTSPVSDTTILSAMFSGCDLMDHTYTQMPLALLFAGLGVVCSTLAALFVL